MLCFLVVPIKSLTALFIISTFPVFAAADIPCPCSTEYSSPGGTPFKLNNFLILFPSAVKLFFIEFFFKPNFFSIKFAFCFHISLLFILIVKSL